MDFAVSEFEARTERAQRLMAVQGLDALFFTSEPELRYFTGFRTLFLQSPTRPWFLIVPASGKPIAVIPEIGAVLMAQTWIEDIHTWSSPHESDDGLSLLMGLLGRYSNVGMMMGRESLLRMALSDFEKLRSALPNLQFTDASPLIAELRFVKSETEIEIIAKICGIAGRAFDRAAELFHIGQPFDETFRQFKIALLEEGAEDVPYLVGGKGRLGYGDVISPPNAAPIEAGDVVMLDTGATLKGYFCDFDRNFAFGRVDPAVAQTHETLWHATEAGLLAARPGATCADVFNAMQTVIDGAGSASSSGGVGRLGHGLGIQLTETPSLIAWDKTALCEGAVMTLEPSMPVPGGGMLVHEENIVIRDGAPQVLTPRASKEMPIL